VNAALYRRARDVFVRAIELEPADRARLLDTECATDPDLRVELESLLAAHTSGTGLDRIEPVRVPERIGDYRVLDVLGEGGMGVVYLAEQDNPRRRVALKVLHPGIASPSRIQRFRHEAQILGRLHHPGIAQVYEAGAEDTGAGPQPYLALELVLGRTIVEHAAAGGLGVRERLDLLVQVCRAAQHAHERGVVHRDLKPANILVDENGAPKILDFGIARAAAEGSGAPTLVTRAGEVLGTLPYMSPEQLGADPALVDARADVYALGVVGYELLSGRLPVDLHGKSLPEAARAIREQEPAPLGALSKALRGDLETIFARALEKERDRRYASARDLADDLRRFLDEEPIFARPPSTMYQLAKFARRNRVLVGGIAGIFLVLVLGIAGTTWQAIVADRKTAQAVEAVKLANAEAARVRSSYRFIEDTLQSADPKELGRDVKVVDVLEGMAARIGTAFAADAESEATVRHTIGLTYFVLGRSAEAEPHLRRAFELFGDVAGPRARRTAQAECLLGRALINLGRLGEAEPLLRESRDVFIEIQGTAGIDTMNASKYVAQVLGKRGRLQEAETMLREAISSLPETHPMHAAFVADLGIVLKSEGRFPDAAKELERAVRQQEAAAGAEDRDALHYTEELASVYSAQGKHADAEAMIRKVWDGKKKMLGEERADTLTTLNNLATEIAYQGRLDDAVELWNQVLAIRRRVLGEAHPNTFATKHALMNVSVARRRLEDADAFSEEMLHDLPRMVDGECIETIQARTDIAHLRLDQERAAEAEAIAREAYVLGRDRLHLDPRVLSEQTELLGMCLVRLERYEEAEARIVESADVRSSAYGDADPRTRNSLALLRDLYQRWNKPEQEAAIAERLGEGR